MYDFLVGDTADISVPIKNHSGDVDRQHSESSSCETDKEKLIFFPSETCKVQTIPQIHTRDVCSVCTNR